MVWITLESGDSDPSVRDLRDRLRSLGFHPGGGGDLFDAEVEAALRAFQEAKGLEVDGRFGPDTARALDDANFSLGDRLLCVTHPMMRGDDVSELQLNLGRLGFDAGRVDGFFGPDTQRALGEFQQNAGVVCDQVCGPETISALSRMESRGSAVPVSGLREREHLRDMSFEGEDLRVALCHRDTSDAIIGALGSELVRAGATVAIFVAETWSELATHVNDFDATLCIAVEVVDEPKCDISYFATEGFESYLGSRLAEAAQRELPKNPLRGEPTVHGKRLAILRETRAPSVYLQIGARSAVAADESMIAAALHRSLIRSLEPQDAQR